MGQLVVLAEHLAVVARHDDDRVVERADGFEGLDQAPDVVVRKRDFPRVEVVLEPRCERLGRRIVVVWIVVVKE